jgi:G3E family GTPase
VNLAIVAGFLGSGKTTLILSVAQQLVAAGSKVAIVENEAGEIGIDGELIRRVGLTVRELFNGCICCQLSADLVPTLEAIAAEISPDWVIIEPSGIAEPKRVLAALPYYRGPRLNMVRTLTLMDPTRIPEIFEVLTPLITAQIRAADVVVINKSDLASDEQLAATRTIVRQVNPRAPVVALSAKQGVGPNLLNLGVAG